MAFSFIEPMLLLAAPTLPEGWLYELKLDGYRALAAKIDGKVYLRSRNDNDFAKRYANLAKALAALPDGTVLDGEVVALDTNGMPNFNLLQHAGSKDVTIVLYVFAICCCWSVWSAKVLSTIKNIVFPWSSRSRPES